MRRFAGFIPGIVIALVSAGLTVGFAHPNFELARVLFLLAGALLMAKPVYDAVRSRSLRPKELGWLLAAVIAGVCLATAGWIWVGNQEAAAQTPPPNVSGNCNNFGNNNTNCNTFNLGPPRVPDGLYQAGQMVGKVAGLKQGPAPNQMTFQNLRISSGTVDLSRPLEFQGALISCQKLPHETSAAMTVIVTGPITCDVLETTNTAAQQKLPSDVRPKDCPPGYIVIYESEFSHAERGITAPKDAHLCVVKTNVHDNTIDIELR